MLDHLLLNKLKWFNIGDNTDQITANGKTWTAHPASIVVADEALIETLDDVGSISAGDNWYANGQQTVKCLAKSGDKYAICGPIRLFRGNDVDDQHTCTLALGIVDNSRGTFRAKHPSVISENWGGGKSLLSHLYQWFRNLYRMVVIAC